MALVDLPTTPGSTSIEWQLRDFGGVQQGPLGGSAQRVNRPGSRWQVTISLPTMEVPKAREWAMKLTRGLRDGVRWKIKQPGAYPSSAGAPLVNGANQDGDTLSVDGFLSGYVGRIGQPFSVVTDGQRYIYRVYESFRGGGTIKIEPELRTEPNDNDVCEFAAPYIEGLIPELPPETALVASIAAGFSFTIMERK